MTKPNLSTEERFRTAYTKEDSCWTWSKSVDEDGYGRFALDGKSQKAHRVAWELVNGPVPDGMCVLHKCDIRHCVNPDHLFLGTKKDNTTDMLNKGRHEVCKGEEVGTSVLTENQVVEIRSLYTPYSKTHGRVALAKRYGVTPQAIGHVVTRLSWSHVGEEV